MKLFYYCRLHRGDSCPIHPGRRLMIHMDISKEFDNVDAKLLRKLRSCSGSKINIRTLSTGNCPPPSPRCYIHLRSCRSHLDSHKTHYWISSLFTSTTCLTTYLRVLGSLCLLMTPRCVQNPTVIFYPYKRTFKVFNLAWSNDNRLRFGHSKCKVQSITRESSCTYNYSL
jgi:hypothetical protein